MYQVAADPHDASIVEAARASRFHNPSMAARLLTDARGEPESLVSDLAASDPYLAVPTMNDLIRRAAGRDR